MAIPAGKETSGTAALPAWGIYSTMVFYGKYAARRPERFDSIIDWSWQPTPAVLPELRLSDRTDPSAPQPAAFFGWQSVGDGADGLVIGYDRRSAFTSGIFFNRIEGGDFLPLLIRLSNYIIFAFFGLVYG